MTVELRPLRAEDVGLVSPMAWRAFDDLALRQGRPPRPSSPETLAAYRGVHEHLQRTDPGGCLLALLDGEPVGAALSYRRGPLWVLSLLVVEPGRQSGRAGSALLAAVLADAPPLRLLHASSDARAMRLYARSGFRLHPALAASGTPDPAGLVDAPVLLACAPTGPLAADLTHALAHGGTLSALVDDPTGRRGTVVVVGPPERRSVLVLDPVDEASGQALLRGALAVTTDRVDLGPLTAQQHWAVEVALEARLELTPTGPVALAGDVSALAVAPPAAVYV